MSSVTQYNREGASGSRPRVGFCMPLMNRLADLKETLASNLDVVRQFDGAARLHVGCFDADDECARWVHQHFADALEAGWLQFHHFTPLPHWHFCWAKNAFVDVIDADYYSSLDADNYLSADEVTRLIALIEESSAPLLIHHFSGQWGDGTSGRVTLPADLYRERPYLDELMPRQFDEIAVMLKLVVEQPDIVYVSRPGVNVLERSRWCHEFLHLNGIEINHREEDLGAVVSPENPRGHDYIHRDERLSHFHRLNADYARWRLSCNESARKKFHASLEQAQQDFVRSQVCRDNPGVVATPPVRGQPDRSAALTLYAVNHNNYEFLDKWLAHYRAQGVERFIVVDDESDEPLEQYLEGDDVFIFRPRFGAFRVSKVFWLRALMGAWQEPGSWVLTVDVDEFLDAPAEEAAAAPLADLIRQADGNGWDHYPALLIDMMPHPDGPPVNGENFIETMDWHYERPPNADLGYQEHQSVRWAFGDRWPLALAVDIRFRLFGTLDCLRKLPLFRFRESLYLNQGFHTLLEDGAGWSLVRALPPGRALLPLRHYKMVKFFEEGDEPGTPFERTNQYFGRTQQNLERIAAADRQYTWRCWRATPFKRRYRGPRLLEANA